MSLYKLSYLFGFITMLLINLKTKKKYQLRTNETIIITVVTYICGVVGALAMGKIYGLVMSMNGLPGSAGVAISGAVMFTPLLMAIFALIAKKDWKVILDLITPGVYAILAWAKFGCATEGCCHGIICDFGIYNPRVDATVFPVQWLEFPIMFIMVIATLIYIYKTKNYVSGTIYPMTTMAYTAFRFFIEFLRYYEVEAQRHVMFGLTLWQFCCVVMFIVSMVWLIVLRKRNKSIN